MKFKENSYIYCIRENQTLNFFINNDSEKIFMFNLDYRNGINDVFRHRTQANKAASIRSRDRGVMHAVNRINNLKNYFIKEYDV